MKAAPALLLSSITAFVLMLVDPTEGASITLFPVGVVLAFSALVAGAVRRRGAAQAGSTAIVVVALVVLFFAAAELLLFLSALMGGNHWE